MTLPDRRRLRRVFAALAAALAALAAGATLSLVIDPDGEGPGPAATISVRIDGPDQDVARDDQLELGEAAQRVLADATATPERFDLGGDLRGRDPQPTGQLDGPLAAQEWPGCKTAFVKSFSSRRGAKIRGFALHYTAGGNLPGEADMRGLTAYSANTANQVSWHFLVDREGHCYYNVPITMKAWTIAALNPETVNVEVIGRGTEADYAGSAGMKKLAEIYARLRRIHPQIEPRLAAVRDCRITRAGILTHWMGGACSGGHHDISPYSIEHVIAQIHELSAVGPPTPPQPPSAPRRVCDLRVASVQRALNRAGARPRLRVDGIRGPATRAATVHFQRARRLDADGITGPKTAAALGLCRTAA